MASFLFAVQLLGTATAFAAPLLDRILRTVVGGDASALGLSWLAAYVLGNGSVVAALALSLATARLLDPSQLFLMVVGSRLGATAIVVFVGALDYVQKRRYSLGDSLGLGLLAFLTTYAVYLPVVVLGYLLLPALRARVPASTVTPASTSLPTPFGGLTDSVVHVVGPTLLFPLAVVLLFGGLRLFDRVFSRVDTQWLRDNYVELLGSRWVSFGVGFGVTMLSTSVAFSLGVLVPLYNRGYVKRRELVPYLMGANVGTLADTLVVAAVLGDPVGVRTVVGVIALSAAVTLLYLAAYPRFFALVDRSYVRVATDRTVLAAFLTVLVLTPAALLLVR
ncbi:MAG: sodium:phosphate symporter [Haloferacaceae archaeon]